MFCNNPDTIKYRLKVEFKVKGFNHKNIEKFAMGVSVYPRNKTQTVPQLRPAQLKYLFHRKCGLEVIPDEMDANNDLFISQTIDYNNYIQKPDIMNYLSVADGLNMIVVSEFNSKFCEFYYQYNTGQLINVAPMRTFKKNVQGLSLHMEIKACDCSVFINTKWESLHSFRPEILKYNWFGLKCNPLLNPWSRQGVRDWRSFNRWYCNQVTKSVECNQDSCLLLIKGFVSHYAPHFIPNEMIKIITNYYGSIKLGIQLKRTLDHNMKPNDYVIKRYFSGVLQVIFSNEKFKNGIFTIMIVPQLDDPKWNQNLYVIF